MGTTTVELKFLAWTVVFGLVQVLIAAQLGVQQRGLMWNVGARDEMPPPLTGYAARADRALKNFLETFPFFAAVVLGALATGRASAATALGVQLYFWARLAYFPVYLAGIPFLRTLIWVVSLWGLIKVLWALF
jgi:uncharacterized MAPEG superfamily protein